ncbi:MAG TPA: queuosine precursor transporter [Bacteroidales bacterium]|nr:queuosine precursor transporter [Bacteroidales bacterium]HRZ75848.1 queuosine precursor transporter [Bacteroidales bacterium]
MTRTKEKLNRLYLVLSLIFLANALLAEFGGVKIFSAGKLLGLDSMDIGGLIIDYNLSVGVLIWPLVFVLSDLINEYFGRKVVRWISIMTAILISYSFLIAFSWTSVPPADFWLEINGQDAQGRPFDINYAYNTIFRQGMGIIAGSLLAFLVSQLIDAYTFHWLRRLTGHRMLWLRATGSTVVSQLIDSFVILTVAFYVFGNWSFGQVMRVGVVQYGYKVLFAIALTPLIYLAHHYIDKYLGKEEAGRIQQEAETGS